MDTVLPLYKYGDHLSVSRANRSQLARENGEKESTVDVSDGRFT